MELKYNCFSLFLFVYMLSTRYENIRTTIIIGSSVRSFGTKSLVRQDRIQKSVLMSNRKLGLPKPVT